jgi:RNA recognition motif-containing protein
MAVLLPPKGCNWRSTEVIDITHVSQASSPKRRLSLEGPAMNIYVGNLSRDVTEDELRAAFEAFGQVKSVSIITDKFSGESRGFGFVEMPEKAEAEVAMGELNGKDMKGRSLNVNEARPRPEGRRGGPRGGGRRGGGGGGPRGGGGGGRGGGPRGGGGGGRGGPRRPW